MDKLKIYSDTEITQWQGKSNNFNRAEGLLKGNTYKDLSTVCIIPCRSQISPRVVQSWMNLFTPMNQKFCRLFVTGMEVGDAYTSAIEQILANPELSKFKFLMTMEDDNMPPPDGLLKLYESIEKYDVVGGLYWTKGEAGQPMIYGDPKTVPLNFIPQVPYGPMHPTIKEEGPQECRGLGMGFNLFRLAMFKDPKLPKPFFKTVQDYEPQKGARGYTQDLYFFENAGKLGYKFACDTRVKVGHYDFASDVVW